jgi:hypothetical protein
VVHDFHGGIGGYREQTQTRGILYNKRVRFLQRFHDDDTDQVLTILPHRTSSSSISRGANALQGFWHLLLLLWDEITLFTLAWLVKSSLTFDIWTISDNRRY